LKSFGRAFTLYLLPSNVCLSKTFKLFIYILLSKACSTYGVGERCIQGLMGKPEGKRLLVKPRRRWKYNIKMDLQEVGCGDMDWIDLRIGTDGWHL